jgi:hypothetical protein
VSGTLAKFVKRRQGAKNIEGFPVVFFGLGVFFVRYGDGSEADGQFGLESVCEGAVLLADTCDDCFSVRDPLPGWLRTQVQSNELESALGSDGVIAGLGGLEEGRVDGRT